MHRSEATMPLYTIDKASNSRRKEVEDWLFGLDLVSPGLRENIVTAWVTTWGASPYERLEDMPFSAGIEYPLMAHVNEVTMAGLDLAKRAKADWKTELPPTSWCRSLSCTMSTSR